MTDRERKKKLAVQRTAAAQKALDLLDRVLIMGLGRRAPARKKSFKKSTAFLTPRPQKPLPPKLPALPVIPSPPKRSDSKYSYITSSEAEDRFAEDYNKWQRERERAIVAGKKLLQAYERHLKEQEEEYKKALALWERNREQYPVVNFFQQVLNDSIYPERFSRSFELEYNLENNVLIVDFQLPSIDQVPTLKEVRYVQTRDEFVEKHISEAQRNRLYDKLLYQIALRTLHELYETDENDVLSSIVFNGYVPSVDPATGHEILPCVLSLQANKEEFMQINLAKVEPKACFKRLKGVGSSKLHVLAPVAPLLEMERDDKRFVTAYAVADDIQESDNLAAMDWEDFEHLIRELFEKEFSGAGSEVKVTRASRDGGIDAVVFNPDPLHGGKIVVQAKRYTNIVGVSAVRDLYGTVINEGANKGILVTTADYGPDAYEFAKNKPLTLLNGGNLLHLLEKHGHKARIDVQEAKAILRDRTNY